MFCSKLFGTIMAPCLIAGLAICSPQNSDDQETDARDLFWSSADLLGKKPAATSHKTPSVHPPKPKLPMPDDSTAQKISVAAPLGLRYSVLKKLDDGTYQEISPDSAFHNGDKIRLRLMSNQAGYLYVIERGSSGNWQPLYPAANTSSEANKVQPGVDYVIPDTGAWSFKGDPGQEKLFVLLSRSPETNLEETIASLKNHQTVIDDQAVAQLRSEVQGRDLVFTSGDDASANDGDKASYVVNKASGQTPDPHVVVDVVLAHK